MDAPTPGSAEDQRNDYIETYFYAGYTIKEPPSQAIRNYWQAEAEMGTAYIMLIAAGAPSSSHTVLQDRYRAKRKIYEYWKQATEQERKKRYEPMG